MFPDGILGKGYDGVPATRPGVVPPRIVLPDSVEVVVVVGSGVGELSLRESADSSSIGDTVVFSVETPAATELLADISRISRSFASRCLYWASCVWGAAVSSDFPSPGLPSDALLV